eukprot:scaffold17886_cov44-Cyclotella_meneghiniana.AAC.3
MKCSVARELPRVTVQLVLELKKWYQENKPTFTEEQEVNPILSRFLFERALYLEKMHTQEHDEKCARSSRSKNVIVNETKSAKPKKIPLGRPFPSSRDREPPQIASSVPAGSNPRGGPRGPPRPLADVSGSRGNVPRPSSRSRQGHHD